MFPYLSDFYMAKQVDVHLPYNLKYSTLEYMAPEFIENYIENQNSFKLDVYSYALTILFLFTGEKPFIYNQENENELMINIVNGKRPIISSNVPDEWKHLIINCWNNDPNLRPDFTQICQRLESPEFVNERIDSKSFLYYQNEIFDNQELDAKND